MRYASWLGTRIEWRKPTLKGKLALDTLACTDMRECPLAGCIVIAGITVSIYQHCPYESLSGNGILIRYLFDAERSTMKKREEEW